jgi:hypothetical protein
MALPSASSPAARPRRIPNSGLDPRGRHDAVRGRNWNGVYDGGRGDIGARTLYRRRFRHQLIATRRLVVLFTLNPPRRPVRAATLAPVLGFDRRNRRVPKCFPVELDARILRLEGAHHVIVEGLPPDLHVGWSSKPVENALTGLPTAAGNRLDHGEVLVSAPVS